MSAARRTGRRIAWPATLALALSACSSSGGGTAGVTTVAGTTAATTVAGTTVVTTIPPRVTTSTSVTTTTAATTTTTVAPSRCAARSPTRASTIDAATEAALATFRPLAASPSIVLDVQPPEYPTPADATVGVERIPGGLLVISRLGPTVVEQMPATPTTLTALDWDGTVRWVRCLAEPYPFVYLAPSTDAPDVALFGATTFTARTMRTAWTGLSLIDGSDVPSVAERFAALDDGAATLRPATTTGRWLVLEPEDPAAGADLVLVDLVTMAATAVSTPPVDDQRRVSFSVTDDGMMMALDGSPDGAVVASWRDGRWRAGASGTGIGTRVAFVGDTGDQRGQLRGVDASGRVRWSVPGRFAPSVQATGVYPDGATALAQTCEPIGSSWDCTYRLTAVDIATGAVRWELPGLRLVAGSPADGSALVSEGDVATNALTWQLVDTATGDAVPGQRWVDPDAFSTPCCGASEYDSTRRHGGVVVVVQGRSVRVWLPADVSLAGWQRRLP